MQKRFKDKVALITGAGTGIGRTTAQMFADEGATVVVADWAVEPGEETVHMIQKAGGEATFVKADVSQAAEVEHMVNTTMDTYNRLDILFNNAGIEHPLNPIVELPEQDWDRVIAVDLKGVFLGIKYGVPALIKSGGGAIVSASSMCGLIGFTHMAAYNASKAGVILLTKTAALEYASNNIRVNCICPGSIDTEMVTRFRTGPYWKSVASTRKPTPLGRKGTTEEIAHLVLFLSSDESSFITGAAVSIDGGYTTH